MTVIIAGVAIGWVCQLYLAMKQARSFDFRVRALTRAGRAAVARGGSRYRGMSYCALAVDEENRVLDAAVLRGVTVFARPADAPHLVGRHLEELLVHGKRSSSLDQAVAEAAEMLLGSGEDDAERESIVAHEDDTNRSDV